MRKSYQRNGDLGESGEVQDALESYVREGAQQMLAAVAEEEVNAFWAVTGISEASVFENIATATTQPVN